MTRYIASTASGQIRGTVNGQMALPFAGEKLGLGTYGKSGCGIIAVYNVLQLLGQAQHLGAIGGWFSRHHRLLLGGLWGTTPHSQRAFLRKQGITCQRFRSLRRLTENLPEGAILLFTVMNARHPFRGFHTMAARYTHGEFVVYNVGSLDPLPRHCANLRESFPGGVFLTGCRVE